jgi:hypothetical protein
LAGGTEHLHDRVGAGEGRADHRRHSDDPLHRGGPDPIPGAHGAHGICHEPTVIDHAYIRWLHTQDEESQRWRDFKDDGWLIERGSCTRSAPPATPASPRCEESGRARSRSR